MNETERDLPPLPRGVIVPDVTPCAWSTSCGPKCKHQPRTIVPDRPGPAEWALAAAVAFTGVVVLALLLTALLD